MALYESVIIGRQDLTNSQFETLVDEFVELFIDKLSVAVLSQPSTFVNILVSLIRAFSSLNFFSLS